MNPLRELLRVEDIQLDLDVHDKADLLERIAALLARRQGLSSAEVREGLDAREQIGSTGLGHGVAIPHARMRVCRAEAAVFVRTKVGIDFDAPDRKPVSLFLGIIVPQAAREHHLRLLAAAATIFNEKSLRDRLRGCADPALLLEIIGAVPDVAVGQ